LLESALIQAIGWALVHFIWQGTVIAAATAIALRAMGGSRATTRYLVACVSLVVMLVAPLWAVLTNDFADSIDLVVVPTAARALPAERVLPIAVVVWMIGVVLLSVRLIAACVGVERLKRATREVDEAVSLRVRVLARRLGVERAVRVLESTMVSVPTIVGCLRPVILLPASVVTGLPASHLDAVLAHELAHVRRHDYLVNVLQAIVETLLFYHPAVWWCSRQIRIEREHCCDDLVVEVCGDRVVYATTLAQLEELRGLKPMLSLNATGGRLIDRVRRVLGEPPMNEGRSATWMIVTALTVVVAAIIVTPVLTLADTNGAGGLLADSRQEPPPAPPLPPRAPQPPKPQTPAAPALPAAPPAPPSAAPALPALPSAPAPAPVPPLPPAPPVAVPLSPPAPLVALPPLPPAPPLPQSVPPAPPAPPAPPSDILQIDPDSIAEAMKRASQQLTASFDDLRRAMEEINEKREALRQAEAEIAKMRVEVLAKNTEIEAIQKSMAELAAATKSEQLGQLQQEALRKQIEAIRKQMESLRAR